MEITELQNSVVYRVQDAQYCEELLIILEDGELRFYVPLELKYSHFEKALKKELDKK